MRRASQSQQFSSVTWLAPPHTINISTNQGCVRSGRRLTWGDLVLAFGSVMASVARIGGALRAGSRLLAGGLRPKAGVRNAGGGGVHIEPRYRQFPELTKSQVWHAEFISSFMWFWILWHLWHDTDAVLGHFEYPDPSKWTDEEIGMPPEDD
uniref:NADH dehydrogenase [ubiquinone] 1 beta subcomplex subunit 2, mitochondrial n=1 Tax=Leptobrachium leishanense TaxID=445787 RepID=A0A8C5Q9W2_9ANUR